MNVKKAQKLPSFLNNLQIQIIKTLKNFNKQSIISTRIQISSKSPMQCLVCKPRDTTGMRELAQCPEVTRILGSEEPGL